MSASAASLPPAARRSARLRSAVRLELRLQKRYGFLYAAAFSTALWLAVLLPLPMGYREVAAPLVIFGDLVVVPFFFIAASLFFEKGERTLSALTVSPLRFTDYLVAKVATLAVLNTALALVIVVIAHGTAFSPLPLLAGVATTSVFMLMLSITTALPFSSVTDWVVPSTFWLTLVNTPLLYHAGLWEHPVLYLVPTQGSLLLLGAAFGQADPAAWEYAYAVGYQMLWVVLLGLLARRLYTRFIVAEGA
ncbi:fluoroquinolone export ABC transporter permease subunit [Streptomonospora nanhaiensis]|uniref:Fluoroquinolone transport system permease protein n=1 Tax=Streptomonospora nanhaiensis TaxID=1323731 RepID=A0A853BLZ4_9ACTN|nr:fluoroquinolone transporter permease [Streptomonospora nanhaiensis]MBV2363353.1 ABC transporter permease [Streptomonospora nanhaiensis]NYI95714.1 fluoroquinolone transport system permease protein [Streptomonospora nanhaiensis]